MTCTSCPNPANCSATFCHFSDAEVETPHDKAARRFWDASPPGYYELIDAPLNFWDRRGIVGKAATVFGAVLACCLAAGVVVGVMT